MKSWLTRAVCAAVLATGALAAPAASAATLTIRDSAGDVGVTDGPDSVRLHGSRANADLLRVRVAHRPRVVYATLVYDDLRRGTDWRLGIVRLRTSLGRTFQVSWNAESGNTRGSADLGRVHQGRGGVRCRGLAHTVDHAADAVTLTVPRSCIGTPRWVRAKAYGVAVKGDFSRSYVDVAGTDRWVARDWSGPIRVG